ncbi:DUF2231 domain-containing protein [Cellulomonas bogoriensis]|uniref:DUF2231 domain-containing protein n=1 Tax=Cellulomonas bogoriensis 69B4 = DSM 16987 TaxID=1386082 RepID=A0A0A0C2Y8_9CELL|nr:DUF2231 domain-containing protein [Cellulomonas bogoriensis]KGM13704.1 hypothetical protein N869_11225 [Cellulomonas bogoriensis 69B4 = DSM 16987]
MSRVTPEVEMSHQSRTMHEEPTNPLIAVTRSLEETDALDSYVDALKPVADRLVDSPARREVLWGRGLGHALHPVLTDVPIGAWLSAITLDLVGGPSARRAARRLVGLGILSAVPTAVTGLAEWSRTEGRDARVGLVHAGGNTVGLALFTASYVSRRREHHGLGVAFGLVGAAVAGASGYLGAHLAIARDVGTSHSAFDDAPSSAA